ncbi:MAG: Hsp20/alpha crystallin family protein [Desulfovibrionaceae bacterium]|nr:Hsp20/alpha crystallin family protein [Desulfovibrionaceae bacterium]
MNIIRIRPWNWLTGEESRGTNAMPAENPANARRELSVNPWGLHREIDRIFDDAFRHVIRPSEREIAEGVMAPKVDISGTEKEYLISAELPGIEEKDIELEAHGDVLSIKAHREHESKDENKDEKRGYYRLERHYGMFQRVLQLPEDADADNITANYKNGVLHISVARKMPQKNEARKISISS